MKKIAIIKLGALGDVVRTLPIAEAIKKQFPDSELTWITKPNALQLLENNPLIDKALPIPLKTNESFDVLYNFDLEVEATTLANKIKANKKYGFYIENNYPMAFNPGAEYYLNTLFDDELKKTNKKTYQEMMLEAAELKNENFSPKIYFNDKDHFYASLFLKNNNLSTEKLIGIHMGAGTRWPSKAGSQEKIRELVIKLKERNYNVILFGGPDEINEIEKLANELKVPRNNQNNTIKEFASLVNLCEKMVCSDSFALHVSLALNKPTVGLFFCTSPHEVEGYNLLTKLVAPKLEEFFPEKMDQYDEELVNSISSDEVIEALKLQDN